MSNENPEVQNRVNRIKESEEITENDRELLFDFHRRMKSRKQRWADRTRRDHLGRNIRLAENPDTPCLNECINAPDPDSSDADNPTATEKMVEYINDTYSNPETNCDYRKSLRVLAKVTTPGDEIPIGVKWVPSGYPSGYDRTPEPKNMITLEEMREIVDTANNPRDACMIAMQWEGGFRGGELYNLEYGDVTEGKHGFRVSVDGKNGRRTVRPFINSTEEISKWLGEHPSQVSSDPLWTALKEPTRISRSRFNRIFKERVEAAGIDKPHDPTNFRKSMQAYLASKNVNEAHINTRAGRKPTSDVAQRYVSVFSEDHTDVIAEAYGAEVDRSESRPDVDVECERCGKMNRAERDFCWHCHQALSFEAVDEITNKEKQIRTNIMKFARHNPELLKGIDGAEEFFDAIDEHPGFFDEALGFIEAIEE